MSGAAHRRVGAVASQHQQIAAEGGAAATTTPGSTMPEPDTFKYTIPSKIPTWAVWVLALLGVLIVGLVACFVMLVVLSVNGNNMKSQVSAASQDLDAIEAGMPVLLHYLQLLINITSLSGSIVPQEIFSQGFFDDPSQTINYVDVVNGSVRMAYRYAGICSGNATRVVFVHALSSSSVEWIEEMVKQSQDMRCAVAVDLLGHGSSDPLGDDLSGTVTNQAMYLFDFLVQTSLVTNGRTVVFVGNGFGGNVIMQLHATQPSITERIILVNPIPYLVKPGDPNATQSAVTGAASQTQVVQLAGLALYNASAYTTLIAYAIGQGSTCTTDSLFNVITAYKQVAIGTDPKAISDALISLATMDHQGIFSGLIVPVLLITGARTGLESVSIVNYALLAETCRDLAGRQATLHIIGAASGAVHLTHHELFHLLANQFITNVDYACDLATIAWSQLA